MENNLRGAFGNKFKVEKGGYIKFFLKSGESHRLSIIRIFDINNRQVDSFSVDLPGINPQNEFSWLRGDGYDKMVDYHANLTDGLYHLENKFTFIVSDSSSKDILIAVPHIYSVCQCESGGGSFYRAVNPENRAGAPAISDFINPESFIPFRLNTNRYCGGIDGLQLVYNFCAHSFPDASIGFISDFDLDDYKNYNKAKFIIFNGNFSFMDGNSYNSLNKYIENGGNIMIAASLFMNNRIRHDKLNNTIDFYGQQTFDPVKDSSISAIAFNNPFSNQKNYHLSGMDYSFADVPVKNEITVKNENDALLQGTGVRNGEKLPVFADYFNGIPLNSDTTIDFKKIRFYDGNIFGIIPCTYHNVAGIASIGVLKKGTRSGKVVCLGTEHWFYPVNIETPAIKKITYNAFNLLLNKKK